MFISDGTGAKKRNLGHGTQKNLLGLVECKYFDLHLRILS